MYEIDFVKPQNFMNMKVLLQILFFNLINLSLFAQTAEVFDQKTTTYSAEIYFDFALYDIRSDADSTLQEVVNYLQNEDGEYQVKITAHTDFIGSNERNQLLSQNRADAVKNYLIQKGFEEGRMEATVFGEEQPQASNDTDDGRQLNRRATIEVSKIRKMLSIEGRIVDEETGTPVSAEIIVRTKNSRDSVQSDKNGVFKLPVPLNTVIGIDIFSKCYFLRSKMFKANPKNLANLKFELVRATAGKASDIDFLYFVGNKDILLPKSVPELSKVLKFMQMSECMKIELAGHVNVPNSPKVAESSAHFDLSTRRAKRVFDYLIENGISKDRIQYKGYGNWEMRYPKAVRETQQAKNRRVEIRVLENDQILDCLCFEKEEEEDKEENKE